MKVFLSGAMRGRPFYGFPAFDDAAGRLRQMGHVVFSPSEHDRAQGFDPAKDYTPMEEGAWLRLFWPWDMAALCRCDAIAMLPGWGASEGANIEYHVATMLGLTILDASTGQPYGKENLGYG